MRYLALATLIVLAAILILLRVPGPQSRPAASPTFSSSTSTPGPAQNADVLPGTPRPFAGDAPWALSALPECFRQTAHREGKPAFARRGIPPGAVRLKPGTTLTATDCRVVVEADSIVVRRGDDRLDVPPDARLYRARGGLVLDRRSPGFEDVRTYAFVRAK